MSTLYPRLASPLGGASHPAVLNRRIRDLLLIGASGLIPLLIALGIALEVPNPNFLVVLGMALGTLGIVAFAVSPRYEFTLALLALYLGLLDGPIKLESSNQGASAVRDVLIAAISVGALVRLVVKREHIHLPPLSGWALAFVALVLVQAANPGTHGILKIVGGFRQHLEWVPLFFFGYIVMRSKERFRKFFLILGVIALANGVVSTIQTQLSPTQLASWGPGYSELINGTGNVSGRTYLSEGVARVRPMALGSDIGFGGFVGVLALPGILALLATGRLRRRWVVVLLSLGVLLAIATSLQRTAVLGAVFALLAFTVFSFSTGRRATRALAAVLVVVALTIVLGSVLTANVGKGVFSRYTSIAPEKAASTSVNYREKTLEQIPTDIAYAPFGAGLATVGAAAYFGGKDPVTIEGHSAGAESQYNFVTLELGLPGLLLWIALSVKLLVLGARRLRDIADLELRIDLVAVFASMFAIAIMGFAGPTMSRPPSGPYFWFAAGIFAYWFAGPGRTTDQMTP
jgi:hypothetical protein